MMQSLLRILSMNTSSKGVACNSSCGVFFWLIFWKTPLNSLQGFSSKFPLEFLLWSLYADFFLLKSPLDSLLNSSTPIHLIICLLCQKQKFERSLIVKIKSLFQANVLLWSCLLCCNQGLREKSGWKDSASRIASFENCLWILLYLAVIFFL